MMHGLSYVDSPNNSRRHWPSPVGIGETARYLSSIFSIHQQLSIPPGKKLTLSVLVAAASDRGFVRLYMQRDKPPTSHYDQKDETEPLLITSVFACASGAQPFTAFLSIYNMQRNNVSLSLTAQVDECNDSSDRHVYRHVCNLCVGMCSGTCVQTCV